MSRVAPEMALGPRLVTCAERARSCIIEKSDRECDQNDWEHQGDRNLIIFVIRYQK